jgi:hypothetical protein
MGLENYLLFYPGLCDRKKKESSMFRKAERKSSKIRLALCGPAGSGKTFSALLIAKGLGEKIAVIDTENGSGELYAHLFDYDVASLQPPFAPKRYVELIKGAEKAGYDVFIIDSLSHAWAGTGGVLDMKDMATKSSKSGNSFTAWRDVTPEHNSLVDAIIFSNLHVIVTMRTKTAWEIVDDGNGRKKPVKIGLSPVQRDGLEYEFTTVLDLSSDHVASCTKDRTSLFDGKFFVPSVETGKDLRTWFTAPVVSKVKHGVQDVTEQSDSNSHQAHGNGNGSQAQAEPKASSNGSQVIAPAKVHAEPQAHGNNGNGQKTKPTAKANGNGSHLSTGSAESNSLTLPLDVLLDEIEGLPITTDSLHTWWYDKKHSIDALMENDKKRVIHKINQLKKMAA